MRKQSIVELPDPTPENVERVMSSPEMKAAIDRIWKDRMDSLEEAERAQREDGPVKFLPAFTKQPVKYPPMKESYCATRLMRPRVYEIALPLEDGLYFIVYFNFLEQNGYTQTTCYWGNIFDFAQKAAAEPYPGAGYVLLSKPFRKKYPHVAAVYSMHEDLHVAIAAVIVFGAVGKAKQHRRLFWSFMLVEYVVLSFCSTVVFRLARESRAFLQANVNFRIAA